MHAVSNNSDIHLPTKTEQRKQNKNKLINANENAYRNVGSQTHMETAYEPFPIPMQFIGGN